MAPLISLGVRGQGQGHLWTNESQALQRCLLSPVGGPGATGTSVRWADVQEECGLEKPSAATTVLLRAGCSLNGHLQPGGGLNGNQEKHTLPLDDPANVHLEPEKEAPSAPSTQLSRDRGGTDAPGARLVPQLCEPWAVPKPETHPGYGGHGGGKVCHVLQTG